MQVVCSLVSIYFDNPQLAKQQKQNIQNFRILIQRYAQFWFFKKGSGNSFSTTFCEWFFKKNVFQVMFYQPTKFHCLIAFTSWDIGQYVYCKCLLSRLWRQRFWNQPDLSNQAVFLHDQNVRTKIEISWERKEPLTWNKKHFLSCLKGFQLPKAVSDLRVRL